MGNTLLKIIWKLDRALLLPLTHKLQEDRTWTPRKWAKGWFMAGHPWLWVLNAETVLKRGMSSGTGNVRPASG
jgi:hypothetical protein